MNKPLHRTLLWLATLVLLLSLTACSKDDPQAPQSFKGVMHKAIALEIWTDSHEYYYSQPEQEIPVHVRATLTNVTGQSPDYLPEQSLVLHSASGDEPVLDIIVSDGESEYAPVEFVWSQENPDKVIYSLTLAPGESYTVEWKSLSVWYRTDMYGVFARWVNIYGGVSQWGLPIDVRSR